MKSLAKNMMHAKRAATNKKPDESKKLLNSDTKQQQYGNGRSRNSSSSSMPNSPQPVRRTYSNEGGGNSILSPDVPMVSIRAGSHPQPLTPTKIEAVMDLDFDKVPFQFYSRVSESWKSAFIQATVLVIICLLVPSLFMLCALYCNKIRMDNKPRMTVLERRRSILFLLLLLVISITKDLIVVMITLHFVYDSPASTYELMYSPFVFFWSLILFAFPLTVFYYSQARYRFGFDSDKKVLLKVFSAMLSNKAKQFEFKKVDDQEKYFNDRYQGLSSIKRCNDEFVYIMRRASKPLLLASICMSVIACLIHSLIPLFLQIMDCSLCRNDVPYYTTINVTSINSTTFNTTSNSTTLNVTSYSTLPTGAYKAVIGLSAVNSLIVSLFASLFFIYLSLWKIAMLSEWKFFNSTESDSTTTLVNGGPQGIAMWWKIRQTLKLFSTSNLSMTVIVGKMACVVTLVIIVFLSVALVYQTLSANTSFDAHSAIPLLFDNILLYLALLIIGGLSFMIGREKVQSGRIMELKQLNVSYELGRMMNMDQETVENEPSIRIKLRVMRGCLMLLQELTSTMENLERSTSSRLVLICLCIATIAVLPSSLLTAKFLRSK